MGTDLDVVDAARVSFDKESAWDTAPSGTGEFYQKLSEADTRLIRYLVKHKHHSPFNHCFASFRVKAPIFVARQLVKHKFMPWNEVSRRYVDGEPEFYFPEVWRAKADNVKQGSSEEPSDYSNHFDEVVRRATLESLIVYEHLMRLGNVCPEQARMVLPQNTMTEWVWSGSLGAFADMCKLRLDSHAQYESRLVAQKISHEMQQLFPVSWDCLIQKD
jgi:thymidylate synthase (FAD)